MDLNCLTLYIKRTPFLEQFKPERQMLKFYRTSNCPRCTEIQEALDEMNFAHKVIMVENRDRMEDDDPKNKKLPLLIDNDKIFEGSGAVVQHLEKLKGFKELWDKFQGDACYCGDEGEIE